MEKKDTLRTLLSMLAVFALSILTGGGIGSLLERFGLFELAESLEGSWRIIWLLALLAAFFLMYFVQVVVHEAGHLVFGLFSGYQFVSYRIGNLLWMKEDGKLVRKRFSLAGTAGQCVMAPPEMQNGTYPQALYNFGGVIFNLISLALFLLAWALLRNSLFFATLFAGGTIAALITAVMNGIPLNFGAVPNDGWNAVHLGNNTAAKQAFWVTLRVNALQYLGKRLRELPEAWFVFPDAEQMKNGIVASLGVFCENRHMDLHEFEAAEQEIPLLLDSRCRAADLYKKLLLCDRVYCELLRLGRASDTSMLSDRKMTAFLKQMKDFPSVIRTHYAVALLKNEDASEAKKHQEHFERVAISYPARADIDSERELMELALQHCRNGEGRT